MKNQNIKKHVNLYLCLHDHSQSSSCQSCWRPSVFVSGGKVPPGSPPHPPSGSCHQSITSNKLPFNCQSRNLHIAYIYVWFGFQNQDPPTFNQSRPFKLPPKYQPSLFQYFDCQISIAVWIGISIFIDLRFIEKIQTVFAQLDFVQPRVARGSRCCGSITCNKLAFNCQSSHKPHLTREGITGSYYSEKQRTKTQIKLFEIGATRE